MQLKSDQPHLQQPRHHAVAEDDGLELAFDVIPHRITQNKSRLNANLLWTSHQPHLQQPRHHAVAQDDGLELALDVVAVLARQHVHLALVHAQLADVRLQNTLE